MASLTDLRGRIVRCDTSISKLSSELRNCSDSIKQVNGQQQDIQNKLLDRIHNLESKVIFWGFFLEMEISLLFHFKYFIDKLKWMRQQARSIQILSNNKMEQRQNNFTNVQKLIRI